MPIYEFKKRSVKATPFELFMSYEQRAEYLAANPDVMPILGAPRIVSGVGDRAKNDAGFNEVMSKIAENNPQSPLAETFGSKSIKSVKTRDAVRKASK